MPGIEYSFVGQFESQLNIEDIGNCAVEANNDDGQFWYLIIDTRLGWTKIMQYGPINPQSDTFEDSCECTFSRIEFDAKKIYRVVDMFLNKTRKKLMPITQAREISRDNALNQCRSIIEYMKDTEKY